jgi:hypothetical protein
MSPMRAREPSVDANGMAKANWCRSPPSGHSCETLAFQSPVRDHENTTMF